jgi:hypothetical protein
MREDDQAARAQRDAKITGQGGRTGGDFNGFRGDGSHGAKSSTHSADSL